MEPLREVINQIRTMEWIPAFAGMTKMAVGADPCVRPAKAICGTTQGKDKTDLTPRSRGTLSSRGEGSDERRKFLPVLPSPFKERVPRERGVR